METNETEQTHQQRETTRALAPITTNGEAWADWMPII